MANQQRAAWLADRAARLWWRRLSPLSQPRLNAKTGSSARKSLRARCGAAARPIRFTSWVRPRYLRTSRQIARGWRDLYHRSLALVFLPHLSICFTRPRRLCFWQKKTPDSVYPRFSRYRFSLTGVGRDQLPAPARRRGALREWFNVGGSFLEQFGVRTRTDKDDGGALHPIDQQEVAADVTFTVVGPIALERWSSHSGPSGVSLPRSSSIASFRRFKSYRPERERRSQSLRKVLV